MVQRPGLSRRLPSVPGRGGRDYGSAKPAQRTALLLALFLAPSLACADDCRQVKESTDESFRLETQADVDSLSKFARITSLVDISGDEITNLDSLKCLTRVDRLRIANTTALVEIPSFTRLESFSSILISENEALQRIGGLGGESATGETLGYAFTIEDNPVLEDAGYWDGLVGIQDRFWINSNFKLVLLDGFPDLEYVFSIEVSGNDSLQRISDLSALRIVVHTIVFSDNASLEACDDWRFVRRLVSTPDLWAITPEELCPV